MKQQKTINIYIDGACKGNPGPGGWGVVIEDGQCRQLIGGREDHTTNNRMELKAAVEALKQVIGSEPDVHVITDSEYLQKGITERLPKWKARGWKTANKQPVQNPDLWKELDNLNGECAVSWLWVRGHSGNAGNELADSIANRAIAQGKVIETVMI